MLHDPKWDPESATKYDPAQLGPYTAWLEKQPAHEAYCYSSNEDCPTARYFTALGYSEVEVVPGLVSYVGGETKLPYWFDVIACNGPRTYGAALDRARALAKAAAD